MRLEEELRWAREVRAIAENTNHPSQLPRAHAHRVQKAGFAHLLDLTAEELDEHIERLERDIQTVEDGLRFDEETDASA